MQQHLPFTVLKLTRILLLLLLDMLVATALTVYGIETLLARQGYRQNGSCVATALTVYGIETLFFANKF